jgi:hypothetical protein
MPAPKWLKQLPIPQNSVGIVITLTVEGRFHVGLAYRRKDSEAQVLHLLFHAFLKSESIQESMFQANILKTYWVQLDVDKDRIFSVVKWCRKIALADLKILYGIYYNGGTFNDESIIALAPGEVGWTCATFILALLKAAQIDLIDFSSWQERSNEDLEFHNYIVEGLKNLRANRGEVVITKEHIEAVEKERGCIRIRPEEVTGACSKSTFPVSFNSASNSGAKIKQYYQELS